MTTLLRETNADLADVLEAYTHRIKARRVVSVWGEKMIKLAIRCGEALLAQHGTWAVPDVEEFERLREKAQEVLKLT